MHYALRGVTGQQRMMMKVAVCSQNVIGEKDTVIAPRFSGLHKSTDSTRSSTKFNLGKDHTNFHGTGSFSAAALKGCQA
jgi:triosephosphate isomerase